MSSSKSSQKRGNKVSFKPVSPFQLFYQLTYMSAMAAAGISRARTFELAALSSSPAAEYFAAINTLVIEFRYDYPEACRNIAGKCKSDNMKTFLLRFSDALRSGEPLAEFLAREAGVQGEDYENKYERDLEAMKQWSNAFSSIVISVSLIVVIQMISAMIYSMNPTSISMMVFAGLIIGGFGGWIIYRSAPHEIMPVSLRGGSPEQIRAFRVFRLLTPVALATSMMMNMFMGIELGWALIWFAALMLPAGILSLRSDKKARKQEEEFSTFLRSVGGMATSSGTTIKQALTKLDLTSFPMMEPDIKRLSTRLQAGVAPEICWHNFGVETGSKLISEVVDIFFSGVRIGGDPERVGYLCSLFTAKTTQLRAKRKLIAGTFSGLTTVMQGVVSGVMVFVLSIVRSFAEVVTTLLPTGQAAAEGQQALNMSIANLTPAQLDFLNLITVSMVLILGLIGATAIILGDGGYKPKISFYLSLIVFISGASLLLVPPMVAGILK